MSIRATLFIDGKQIVALEKAHKLTKEEGKFLLAMDAERELCLRKGRFESVTKAIWDKLLTSKSFQPELVLGMFESGLQHACIKEVTHVLTCCKAPETPAYKIKKEAFDALIKFRETGEAFYADTFRELLLKYKNTISRQLKELRRLLSAIKKPVVSVYIDFRKLVRRRSKHIARNIDDEHTLINNSYEKLQAVLINSNNNHGYQHIKSNNQRPGIFLL